MTLLIMVAAVLVLTCGCGRTGLLWDGPDAGEPLVNKDAADVHECEVVAETCNGQDDDCDGQVDEDIAPEPCPTGGSRFCVGGRWSRCPCACVPGAVRYCFDTYCTGWGVSTCRNDGLWEAGCQEVNPPSGCGYSWEPNPDDEQCCLEMGGCCSDRFDLDGDGDTSESIGNCDGMVCN